MDDNLKAIDLGDAIDQAPLGALRIFAIVACALVAVIDGFDAQSIGMVAPDIGESLGIARTSFGPIFSAGFFGMFTGALLLAPLADRHGRKPMLLLSTLIFGLFSLATAFSTGLYSLMLLRFLTGVGLGGALPNILAYVSEYLPKKHVRTVIPILIATVPLGAILGGALTSLIVPRFGWQAFFIVGGIVPILLALLLLSRIPESARYLIRRPARQAELERIMRRITGHAVPAGGYVERGTPEKKSAALDLFRGALARPTILLWIACFFNILIIFFIISWIPSLLRASELTRNAGVLAVTAFSFGGLGGSLAQGALMNRFGVRGFVMAEFVVTMGCFIALAAVPASMGTGLTRAAALFALLGFMVNGIQAGLNVIAIETYPTPIRATGIGWAGAVGRLGSMVGPLVGGLFVSLHFTISNVYLFALLPAGLAALATFFNKTK